MVRSKGDIASLGDRVTWNTVSTLAGSLCRLISGILVARALGPELAGIYSYATWIVEVAVLLFSLGFHNSLIRFTAEYEGRRDDESLDSLWTWNLWFHIIMGLLAGGLLCRVGTKMFFKDIGPEISLLSGILLFFQLGAGLTHSFLVGRQRFLSLAKVTCVSGIVTILGQILGLCLWELPGALVGSAAGYATTAFFIPWLSKSFVLELKSGPLCLIRKRPNPAFFRYSITTWFAYLISSITWGRTEIFFLDRYGGSVQVGFFSVGLIFSSVLTQTVSMLAGTLLPHFSRLVGRGDEPQFKEDYRFLTITAAMAALPMTLCAAAFMPQLMELVFGKAYEGALPSSRIMVLTGLWSFAAVGSAAVYGLGESGFILKWGLISAFLVVAGCFLLVPPYGAVGAASTRLTVQAIMVGIGTMFLRRRHGFPFPWRSLTSIALASSFSALICLGLAFLIPQPSIALACGIPFGACIYVLFLRIFKALSPREALRLTAGAARLPLPLGKTISSVICWVAKE